LQKRIILEEISKLNLYREALKAAVISNGIEGLKNTSFPMN
jgi:hypothetical protein